MNKFILTLCLISTPAWAQENPEAAESSPDAILEAMSVPMVDSTAAPDATGEDDWGRDPAAVPPTLNTKRSYPGGADEEDLRVQAALPEAALKTDARSVQREVYKALYNQELKDDRHDPVEE